MKDRIQNLLPASLSWRDSLIFLDCVDSTNTLAKAMALEGAAHGTVLVAAKQTAGRGRMGRSFQSPEGGIYMSVILRYNCPQEQLMHLTCSVAVAMCDAVQAGAGFRPRVKWTNDLVQDSRKLGGILTELVPTKTGLAAIVGIGINCCQKLQDFPEDIQSFAGSLAMCTGQAADRAQVAAAMIESLYTMDSRLLRDRAGIMAQYRADCMTVGRDISLVRGDKIRHGHAFGIDENGGLLVRFSDGHEESVSSGEVSVRGMYGYV